MIFLKDIESINEVSLIRKSNMCVSIDPSPNENYGNIAYFKVYNNSSPKAATEVIRLHFYDAGYEAHKGKPLFKMKKKDKEELMRLLISHPTNAEYSIYNTTWEALIAVFNRVVKPQDKLPLELPIPDYTKIII